MNRHITIDRQLEAALGRAYPTKRCAARSGFDPLIAFDRHQGQDS